MKLRLVCRCASILLPIGLSTAAAANPDCSALTKAKLAVVETSQRDRDVLCAGMALVSESDQATFTVRDFGNITTTGQRLRRNGYMSATMYYELIVLAGIRTSSETEVLANAFEKSNKCLTPQMVIADMLNAIKSPPKGDAARMYRGWDRQAFTTYVVMVAYDRGCKFQ